MQLLTQISVSQYRAPKSVPATIILADGGPLIRSTSGKIERPNYEKVRVNLNNGRGLLSESPLRV